MKFGYVRLSNQKLEQQLNDLRKFGCESIVVDRDPPAQDLIPPKLAEIVDKLHEGDVIVVWKLDLLGLSLRYLIEFVSSFRRKGIELISLKDDIDTENGDWAVYL